MIVQDPHTIYEQHYTSEQKNWILVYAVLAAGRSSDIALDKTNKLYEICDGQLTEAINRMYAVKTGKYTVLEGFLRDFTTRLAHNPAWMEQVTVQALEELHGVGPKTARMVKMATDFTCRNRYAVLDVHVLRWLRNNGYPEAPKTTPIGKLYNYWEMVFLTESRKRGLSSAEFDQQIWNNAKGNTDA